MKNSTFISVMSFIWLCSIITGCLLFHNNPDAPSVTPPNGSPDNWPVFKGSSNQVEVVSNLTATASNSINKSVINKK